MLRRLNILLRITARFS